MKTLAVIFNIAIFTMFGYVFGYHMGATQATPYTDKAAIERALHLAIAQK